MAARGVAGWARCLDGAPPVARSYFATDTAGNVWNIDSESGSMSLDSSPSEQARADALRAVRSHAATMQAAAAAFDAEFLSGKAVH